MQLTLSPTDTFGTVDGLRCRVWQGRDENGTPVKAWVRCVQPQTDDAALHALYERALNEMIQPPQLAAD